MGTNYYLYEPPCSHCGRDYEPKHIGKSSAGWCFLLHVIPEEGINDLTDWQRLWEGKEIRDEYGNSVSTIEMLDIITRRGRKTDWNKPPTMYQSWEEFHQYNQSQPTEFGLLRARIDSKYCIGHGAGTWDLIIGIFC